jgi:hypothetical protein
MEACAGRASHHLCANGADELGEFGDIVALHRENMKGETLCLAGTNAREVLKVPNEFVEGRHGLEIVAISADGVVGVEIDKANMLAVEVEFGAADGAVTVFFNEDFCDVWSI